MFNHIVVPVEIGEAKAYENAVKAASTLLSGAGKVTLLHAIEPIPTYVTTYIPPEIPTESRQEALKRLKEMANELDIENTELVSGSAGRTIVDWADRNTADCIVITSHKPEFSDFILGSTAAWVVRHAKSNVLVLR